MSQRLTPVDILNLRFRRRLRGYAIGEVDEFVRRVATDMETLLAENASQRDRIGALERELAQFRLLEATMRDALILAQKAADESRAAARSQSEAMIRDAHARVAEMQIHIETLRQERRRLARDLRAQLTAQLAWLTEELEADETPDAPAPAAVAANVPLTLVETPPDLVLTAANGAPDASSPEEP